MIEKRLLAQIDWILISTTLVLALVGIASIYSATYLEEPSLYQRQTYWLLIGAAIMLPVVIVDYSILDRFAYVIYAASILTLIFALIFGRTVGGAQRWISIGFVSIQPSEFAKLSFILALSKHLSTKDVSRKGLGLEQLIVPSALFVIPFLLVAKQPDLGTALIFFFVFVSMILVVKIKTKILVPSAAAFLAMIPIGWRFLKVYQRARLISFIDPTADPLGSGYHILQSKIAIGSGRFFGKGFTQGTQGSHLFLPAHHTDFIFPTFAEEWGFAGGIVVLALFCILITRGLGVAAAGKDRFSFLLAIGITALFFWHMAINAGMVMGLLPVVGVPMPFLSYGGSFLLTMLLSSAILMNISMRRYIF
ncbi:MAG: rod shape-determining protein RodA [Deltaproteobacteria bacterium]|nr:rod shape-determining protein RodA [Deltaproteobacteria bacterium]